MIRWRELVLIGILLLLMMACASPVSGAGTGATGGDDPLPTGGTGEPSAFKLSCRTADEFLISEQFTYSSDVGPDAATTPSEALENFMTVTAGLSESFVEATFVAEPEDPGETATEFGGLFDGEIRLIVTTEEIAGKSWVVSRAFGCQTEMTALQEAVADTAQAEEESAS